VEEDIESGRILFLLEPLLSELATSDGAQSGNCVDVSSFLHLNLSAQGISSDLRAITASPFGGFLTNPICPIGSDASQQGLYIQIMFTMHQQCWTFGNKVNDAALAFMSDLAGNNYFNPAWRWPMPGYWQTDPALNPPVRYGLVYRRRVATDEEEQHSEHPFKVIIPDPNLGPATVEYQLVTTYVIDEFTR
jgi:hypothetical protein